VPTHAFSPGFAVLAGLQGRIRQHQPLGALIEVHLHPRVVPGALTVHHDALAKLRMANALSQAEAGLLS